MDAVKILKVQPVGLNNLGRAVSAGFGVIVRVLFSAL